MSIVVNKNTVKEGIRDYFIEKRNVLLYFFTLVLHK